MRHNSANTYCYFGSCSTHTFCRVIATIQPVMSTNVFVTLKKSFVTLIIMEMSFLFLLMSSVFFVELVNNDSYYNTLWLFFAQDHLSLNGAVGKHAAC